MAYVQPNSIIQFFKGINLDNRYLHTIYFANETAQDTWFTSKATNALSFTNMMYRRYTSTSVKVEADATTFLGVTYMRFKNTRTAGKWFYAFVLSADYVNENTTLVTYEIDVMQTWFIQGGSVRPCMILREHVNSDAMFEHLEPEPISSDVYEYSLITNANQISNSEMSSANDAFTNYTLMINTTGKPNNTEFGVPNYYRQGLFNGTKFSMAECNNTTQAHDIADTGGIMDSFLGNWSDGQQLEDVIDMSTVPTFFTKSLGGMDNPYNLEVTLPTTLGSYTPKNKKLFSYPYNYLFGTTHNGDAGMYRWEYFNVNQALDHQYIKFHLMGTAQNGAQIMCYPYQYDGVEENYNGALYMADFPKNAFSYDAYQAWLASGGNTKLYTAQKFATMKGITSLVSSGANLVTNVVQADESVSAGSTPGETLGAINKIVQSTTNFVQTGIAYEEAKKKISYQWKDALYVPNETVGSCLPNLMVASRTLNFYFYDVHVKASELTKLDDFFSCYGYTIDKVKAPNLTGRQYWNFVQTQNAVIAGDMPSSSKEAIGRIFDGGITFWHDGDQVGNYRQSVSNDSINNPIV